MNHYQSTIGLCLCTVMSDSLQPHGLFVAQQAPLSMEFSRQEYWSGMPFPTPGNLPDPIIPVSLRLLHWRVDSLPLHHLGSPTIAIAN